jgi:hypothetical protein
MMATVCAGAAYRSGSVANPIRSATTPPSRYESGLVATPNPLRDGGNNIITGNVRGAKHFRGSVPYRSTTSFSGALGSTSLDSFLRYSAVPQELGVSSRSTGAFYSPTGTITTMPPGRTRVFAPTSPGVANGAGQLRTKVPRDVLEVPETPQPQAWAGDRGTALEANWSDWQGLQAWPSFPGATNLPGTDGAPDGFLLDPPTSLVRDESAVPQPYQWDDVPRVQPASSEEYSTRPWRTRPEDQGLEDADSLRRLFEPSLPLPNQVPAPEAPASTRRPRTDDSDRPETAPAETSGLKLYKPPAEHAEHLTMPPETQIDSVDALFLPAGGRDSSVETPELPAARRAREISSAFDVSRDLLQPASRDETTLRLFRSSTDAGKAAATDSQQARVQAASEPVVSARNEEPYERRGSIAAERYARYMMAAELYLQQGRYYRAAESFALASLLKPDAPAAHLGKAHALFAAGDYVSSAIALAQAIDLDPRFVLGRRDLAAVMGGSNGLGLRLADLDACLKDHDAPLLQFLSAYVRYQTDDLAGAKTAIETAEEGLPSWPAVEMLGAAVGQ